MAKHKATNKVYAVKVLKKDAIIKQKEVKHIMSERNVLMNNHKNPFLIGLHYSFQTPAKLYFVLDYVNGGVIAVSAVAAPFMQYRRAVLSPATREAPVGRALQVLLC